MNLFARFMGSLIGCAATAVPARACSYTSAPEPVGFPSGSFLAEGLYRAATFVDLVVAERARPLRAPDGQVRAQAITFRVIQRWKGRSPDRFTLWGEGLLAAGAGGGGGGGGGWLRHHWVDETGRVIPHTTPWEMPADPPQSVSSCDPGFIRPAVGKTYVAFREADGRLLGPVVHHAGGRAERGLEFVEVGSSREDDWFGATFLRSFDQRDQRDPRKPVPPVPVPQGSPDRALLVFSQPLTADAAVALLQRAGVRPYAVYAVAGDFVDELRVPAEWASPTLIGEALSGAKGNLAGEHMQAVARMALRGLTAEDLENDGWKRGYAASVVLAEERLADVRRAGPPLVGSVEVIGTPSALDRLRREKRVAAVQQGFTLRGRTAAPPPPGREDVGAPRNFDEQARALSPAFLLHRLRVIAGELPQNAPAPVRAAVVIPPPPDLRACIRVGAEEARGFPGLVQLGVAGPMRVWGEPDKMSCKNAGPDGRGECTVTGPSRVRLEFQSGVSGFNIPRTGPVVVSFAPTTFGCRAANGR
ncbi:MAG TPA: hypothetical protein VEZ48_09875 [Sphingomonadaceae bacterium]|nr:hypothetical protein [Sphingomonadaceae bacterium]